MDHITVSWVLYTLREVLGNEAIRNTILETELKRIPGLIFGHTFSEEYKNAELIEYLTAITKLKNKRVLFTASNLPDLKTGETHYQTYVVNTKAKTVLMMDPARKSTGKGIYPPIVSREVIRPFFESKQYDVSWADTSFACQIKQQDVFCQSWSLYLQIQSILNPDTQIMIPKSQSSKYELLLTFFKRIIQYAEVCKALNKAFSSIVSKAKPDTITHDEKRYMMTKNPCQIILDMTPSQMFDDEEDKGSNDHPLAVTLRSRS